MLTLGYSCGLLIAEGVAARPVAAALRQHGGLAAGIVAILLGTHALAGAGAATVLGVSVVAAHVVVLVRREALGMAAR